MISVSFCTAISNPNFSKTIWTILWISSLNFEPKISMKESRMTIVSSCAAFWNVPSRTAAIWEQRFINNGRNLSSKLIDKNSLMSHPKAENYWTHNNSLFEKGKTKTHWCICDVLLWRKVRLKIWLLAFKTWNASNSGGATFIGHKTHFTNWLWRKKNDLKLLNPICGFFGPHFCQHHGCLNPHSEANCCWIDPAAATTFPKPWHSKPVPAWHGWADFTFTLHEMFLYQCNVFFLHKRLQIQHCIYDVVWPEVLCLALTNAQLHVFFHVPWSPFEFLLILFPQPCKEFLNIRIPGFLHIKTR